MGDGRPRGETTLKARVVVSPQILRHGPHEYSLPGSFSAHWEQVLSRHRDFIYILNSIKRLLYGIAGAPRGCLFFLFVPYALLNRLCTLTLVVEGGHRPYGRGVRINTSCHRRGEGAGEKRYTEGNNNQPATPHTPASSSAQTHVQPRYQPNIVTASVRWQGAFPPP